MGYARWMILGTAAVLWGCGDGGGPSGPPPPVNVTGGWSFNIMNITAPGAGFSCSMAGTMQLNQVGTLFDGSYHVASAMCTNGMNLGSGNGSVIAGEVYGDSVHFHFDTEDLDQHGVVTASRSSMSGRCTWVASSGGSTVTVTGSWTAHR